MPQPFFGSPRVPLDVLPIKTTNILEFDAFEQIPDAFLRIQFWCISRQTFKMNPLGPCAGSFGHPFSQKPILCLLSSLYHQKSNRKIAVLAHGTSIHFFRS
jgi:hypothetical protein